MSARIEHTVGHAHWRKLRVFSQSQRHKGRFASANGARSPLETCIVPKDVSAGWIYKGRGGIEDGSAFKVERHKTHRTVHVQTLNGGCNAPNGLSCSIRSAKLKMHSPDIDDAAIGEHRLLADGRTDRSGMPARIWKRIDVAKDGYLEPPSS